MNSANYLEVNRIAKELEEMQIEGVKMGIQSQIRICDNPSFQLTNCEDYNCRICNRDFDTDCDIEQFNLEDENHGR